MRDHDMHYLAGCTALAPEMVRAVCIYESEEARARNHACREVVSGDGWEFTTVMVTPQESLFVAIARGADLEEASGVPSRTEIVKYWALEMVVGKSRATEERAVPQ